MLDKIEMSFMRLLLRLRLWYYSKRLRGLMPFFGSHKVGPACPHDIRIPLEQVVALSNHKQNILRDALIDTMRPFGCIITRCRRCYCMTATRITANVVGWKHDQGAFQSE